MECLGLHAQPLQQHGERAHGIGLFLQFDDLEAPEQVTEAVLREAKVIVRRVVNRKEKPGRQQKLTTGNEHAKHFVDRALRFRKMLEDFGAEHDLEAGVANSKRLRIADDLDADAACDVERNSPREVSRVWPILRANVESAEIAGVRRDESIQRDPCQLC